LDFDVFSNEGEDLGDVEDLVINLQSERIQYLVVSFGGLLGLGEREVLIPWGAAELSTDEGAVEGALAGATVLIINMDEEALSNAPDVELDDLGDMDPDAWDDELRTYWETMPPDVITDPDETPPAGATEGAEATPAATEAVDKTPAATDAAGTAQGETAGAVTGLKRVVLASDLLGWDVRQANEDDLGEGDEIIVEEIIVDAKSGKVQYVLISAEGLDDLDDRWIPVPLGALNLTAEGDALLLSEQVDVETLRTAPNFEPDVLPDITVANWDNEIRSFWKDLVTPR
jgi:sporulation protein YlmC with PRC-barrel domain